MKQTGELDGKFNGNPCKVRVGVMDKVYVLTELVDDYYQHGEYFLGVFKDIPTLEEVNACGAYFGKIYKEQYEQLVEDGSVQYQGYHEFLYLKEVEL